MVDDPPQAPSAPLPPRPDQAARSLLAKLARFGTDEHALLLILAVVIGAAAGIAVLAFYKTIDAVQTLVLRGALRSGLPPAVLIPSSVALGLAACRALVRWGASDSPGENVPDVMYRVTVKGGVIPFTPVLVKTLGAAVVIGTGGSVGAEGPVVVLGAATASRIGRWIRSSPNRLRTLVGCGAAAGISAAFNAPIAGVIFGIEKILGAAGGMALGPFVVSSILAASVSRAAFGNHPILAMPAEYGVRSAWELILYVGLGVLTGVVSVLYSRGVWKTQDWFARLRYPWLMVILGALVVGGLDLVYRADLWGHGHRSIDLGLLASGTGPFLLGLAGAKLVATAVTFGAGGTGGVFTPALFIGATLGGAYGLAVQAAVPGWQLAPGALALVGMAGLVAGSTHAPLTAIIMVFEMTGDYGLILPLMLTSVLAYAIARRLYPESIYTEWLARRGVVLTHGADAAVLARIPVADAMNRAARTIEENATLQSILDRTRDSRQLEFPVLDGDSRLIGMLTRDTLREALAAESGVPGLVLAADLAVSRAERVTPEDTVLTAMRRLAREDVNALPVVAPHNLDHYVGLVSREDLFAAYERALLAEGH